MQSIVSVLADAATDYTPADFGTSIATAAGSIMPWVGAGVTGGLALGLIFLGIRKGLGFFKKTAK